MKVITVAKHHYVPRFYLNNFSAEPGQIYVYRRGAEPFISSIRKVAAEEEFYSFRNPDSGTNDDAIEKMFSFIESKASTIISKILSAPALDLDDEEREVLALFISFLFTRGRWYLEWQKNLFAAFDDMQLKINAQNEDQFLLLAREALGDISKDEALELRNDILSNKFTVKYEDSPYFLGSSLQHALELFPYVVSKQYHLLKNDSSRVLITSDCPLVIIKPPGYPEELGIGIANGFLALPISPSRCLLLHAYSRARITERLTRGHVDFLNSHQMHYAYKFIFANLYSKDLQQSFNVGEDGQSIAVKISAPFLVNNTT